LGRARLPWGEIQGVGFADGRRRTFIFFRWIYGNASTAAGHLYLKIRERRAAMWGLRLPGSL